jgi:hypothetical protein
MSMLSPNHRTIVIIIAFLLSDHGCIKCLNSALCPFFNVEELIILLPAHIRTHTRICVC